MFAMGDVVQLNDKSDSPGMLGIVEEIKDGRYTVLIPLPELRTTWYRLTRDQIEYIDVAVYKEKNNMLKQSPIYDGTEENYLELANAIIIQACKDYKALYYKKLTKKHMHVLSESELFKLEKFFRSEWFDFISRTCIDGETLIKHLQEEVQNEIRIERKKRKR